jgi:hypothetical protein
MSDQSVPSDEAETDQIAASGAAEPDEDDDLAVAIPDPIIGGTESITRQAPPPS